MCSTGNHIMIQILVNRRCCLNHYLLLLEFFLWELSYSSRPNKITPTKKVDQTDRWKFSAGWGFGPFCGRGLNLLSFSVHEHSCETKWRIVVNCFKFECKVNLCYFRKVLFINQLKIEQNISSFQRLADIKKHPWLVKQNA